MKKYIVRGYTSHDGEDDGDLLWVEEVEAESEEGAGGVALCNHQGGEADLAYYRVERVALVPRLIIKACRWIVENI